MKTTSIIQTIKGILGDLYNPVAGFLKIIAIILITIVIYKLGSFIIKKIFEKQKAFKYNIGTKKIDTMSTLLVSVFRYFVYIMAAVGIFAELTDLFNLKSFLAAAGIGGLVIGFGAQSLIKDIISGIFIILEDQFVVGDLITIDNMNGTVEEMELRVTKLRSANGDLYVIPNGEIKKVTNHSRGNKAVTVDIPLAYSTDINKAIDVASRVCDAVSGQFESIVEAPKVLGITDMSREGMNLRITARTVSEGQWEVERAIRRLVSEEFNREELVFSDKNKFVLCENPLKGDGKDA